MALTEQYHERINVQPPCNGATSGPEFEALVHRCVGDRHNGSEQAVLSFIEACNACGMTTEQVTAASWIREKHLSLTAKDWEKSRLDRCGTPARELWGQFNLSPIHQERKIR